MLNFFLSILRAACVTEFTPRHLHVQFCLGTELHGGELADVKRESFSYEYMPGVCRDPEGLRVVRAAHGLPPSGLSRAGWSLLWLLSIMVPARSARVDRVASQLAAGSQYITVVPVGHVHIEDEVRSTYHSMCPSHPGVSVLSSLLIHRVLPSPQPPAAQSDASRAALPPPLLLSSERSFYALSLLPEQSCREAGHVLLEGGSLCGDEQGGSPSEPHHCPHGASPPPCTPTVRGTSWWQSLSGWCL